MSTFSMSRVDYTLMGDVMPPRDSFFERGRIEYTTVNQATRAQRRGLVQLLERHCLDEITRRWRCETGVFGIFTQVVILGVKVGI